MERYPQWYKDAIIYQLHVKAFCDSNDDGIGDFRGLTSRLDYIKDLGATAIWLLPFYPSPLRDDGYDISNYRDVNPAYGTLRDVRTFIEQAHKRNLYVLTELVINHTSDQHPWFQRARRAKRGSNARDFYVWNDSDAAYAGTRIIFTDTETSNWTWDPVAQQYYWHRFFSHQPDLNFQNPHVIQAVTNVMRFWLDMGVDGMRLDAVPYLCEREGTSNENLPETHAILKILRAVLDNEYTDRVFLAEANQWPEDVAAYFGDDDECHMAFHFPLMPRMFMSIAEEDRYPIIDIMRQTPEIPPSAQWAIFLRNHDEMTLEMVTDRERDYMYGVYATDPRARINVGIRRRLAPLMDNDRRKIELLTGLLMSMPGTPIVYYGDEIGMGDNIYLGDRDGVRTPMQWSVDRNGGFSRADTHRLYLPPISDPIYGFQSVNVEAQSRSASSLINWMRRLTAVRRRHQVFGRGKITFLTPSNRKVLAYLREDENERVLCVANLSRAPQPVALDLARMAGCTPVELFGRTPFAPITEDRYMLTLQGHAFFWFEIAESAIVPTWQQALPSTRPEYYTLVLPHGIDDISGNAVRRILEGEALPTYLPAQLWFSERVAPRSSIAALTTLPGVAQPVRFAVLETRGGTDEPSARYLLPLAIIDTSRQEAPAAISRAAVARTRTGSHEGLLFDAYADEKFVRALFRAALRDSDEEMLADDAPLRRYEEEKKHAWIIADDRLMLKGYRRLHGGVESELAMLRHLESSGAAALVPRLIGSIENSEGLTVAVVQRYIFTQGDLWTSSLNYLTRFVERHRDMAAPVPETDEHAAVVLRARRLGLRVAELHRSLAAPTDDPAFAPEPTTSEDLHAWREDALQGAADAFALLESAVPKLGKALQESATALLGRRAELEARIIELVPRTLNAVKTRIHGDLHLGTILLCGHDFRFVDFEGDPTVPGIDRRKKHSPLRDLAALLRSVDYAALSTILDAGSVRTQHGGHAGPLVDGWKRRTVAAFLEGYRRRTGDGISVPHEDQTMERLLEFFLIDRTLSDLSFEISRRPAWLAIPIEGLSRLLDRNDPVLEAALV